MSAPVGRSQRDEDGYYLDEWGRAYGYCNACGEEAEADSECCEDGEVVPPDEPDHARSST